MPVVLLMIIRFDMLKKAPVSTLMPVPLAFTMQRSALISGPPRPSVASQNKPFPGLPETSELLTDTRLPAQIRSYDWPEPGETGDLKLAERYTYEQLDFDASLTDLDFDPANPEYAFSRF